MINDIQMLDTITESADMGRNSLKQVLAKSEDPQLTNALQAQIVEYDNCYDAATCLLQSYGQDAKKANPVAKAQSQMTATFKTITAEDPTSKIAEMVIQGSTMGVTKMTKDLHDYTGTNKEITSLAEKHIKTEQANIEEMKKFL